MCLGQPADLADAVEVEVSPDRERVSAVLQRQDHRLAQAGRHDPVIKAEEERVAGHRRWHASMAGGEDEYVVAGRRGPADVAGHADVEHQAARPEPPRLDTIA